jgi:hypothetical protein
MMGHAHTGFLYTRELVLRHRVYNLLILTYFIRPVSNVLGNYWLKLKGVVKNLNVTPLGNCFICDSGIMLECLNLSLLFISISCVFKSKFYSIYHCIVMFVPFYLFIVLASRPYIFYSPFI